MIHLRRICFAIGVFVALVPKVVMLVDKRDGKALDAKEGPLRIVTPEEKMRARWVRQVTGLVVRRAQ